MLCGELRSKRCGKRALEFASGTPSKEQQPEVIDRFKELAFADLDGGNCVPRMFWNLTPV